MRLGSIKLVQMHGTAPSPALLTPASLPHPRGAVCPEACGPSHRRICFPEHWQQRQQQQQQFSLLAKSYLIPGHPQCRALHQLVPLRGRTQLPTPLLSRGKEVDAQNLPHLTEPTSNTIWPDAESLDVSACPGSIQVLLYSGDRERLEGQDRAALSNQGFSWRAGWGLWAASFLGGSQATSHPGHSVSTICKPTQGWSPPYPFPVNLFSLSCLPP